MKYPGIYRAKCSAINGTEITAYIPQVFADLPIVITASTTGGFPSPGEFGFVAFEGGEANFPVWMGVVSGEVGPAGAAASVEVNSVTTGTPGGTASVTNSGDALAAKLDFVIPQGPVGPQGVMGPQGVAGAAGSAATVAVGTVTTLASGSPATVSNGGTTSAATLNFGIPQGAAGAAGAAATVAVGTTTTLAAGSSATVSNSGSSSAATLNFGIPTGATGATGDKGGVRYNYSTSTTSTAAGTFRFNGSSSVFISVTDVAGVNRTSWISTWDDSTSTSVKGQMIVVGNSSTSTTVMVFNVTAVSTATATDHTLTVSLVSGTAPLDGTACVILFSRTGDNGVIAATSSARPASPTDGMVIYETDTDRLMAYNSSTTSWVCPYPLGRLAVTSLENFNYPPGGLVTPQTQNLIGIVSASLLANRKIRVVASGNLYSSAANTSVQMSIVDGNASSSTVLNRSFVTTSDTNANQNESFFVSHVLTNTSAGSRTFGLCLNASAGSQVTTSSTAPTTIAIYDDGPA